MNAPLIEPPVRCALSKHQDPARAAAELAEQLRGPHIGFVLFFCSAEYDLPALGQALARAFGEIELAGCTTAGEVTPQGYDCGSITAVGFDRRLFAMEAALIDPLDNFSLMEAQNLVSDLVTGCRRRQVAPVKGHSFAITLLDGLSSQEELVLMTLNSALGSIPAFGGSAGDDIHLANTHVYHRGAFHSQAAVVILVTTPLDFEVFTTHHMISLNEKLVVTAADPASRRVFELNAMPAAEEYARVAGTRLEALDHRVFALNPVAVRIGQEYYLRSIQSVNEDGSLSFYCAVENGIVLTTMRPGSMIADLARHFGRIEAEIGPPLLTIGCDCFLRRLEAEYRGETEALSRYLRQHGVIGFNTYGEQHDGMHLNQTFTGVVLGRGRRHD